MKQSVPLRSLYLTVCWLVWAAIVPQYAAAQEKVRFTPLTQPYLAGTRLPATKPYQGPYQDPSPERQASPAPERCATMQADADLRARLPQLGTLADFEAWMARALPNRTQTRAVVTIPVIVHVLHDGESIGTGYNISYEQVASQIEILNEDFRRLNADTVNTPSYFEPVAADIEIEFCLATRDEANNIMLEPGIDRINRQANGWTSTSTSYIDNTIKPATYWDPTQYFNIWVIPLSGGLLGYAQFPEAASLPGIGTGNGGASTDGVVINTLSFGRVGNLNPSTSLGRTATHEVGHWLGLRHIWGDGGCGIDDYCNDTPESDAANYGCLVGHISCGTEDMVQNYMDYSDDVCMNIFTQDQKARMQTVITSSIRRASLTSSNRCEPVPLIKFAQASLSTSESQTTGTGCNRYLDLPVILDILAPPTGSVSVQVNVAGTASAADATFIGGNTVTFPVGSTSSQSLTLRIYDDGGTENNETVILTYTILNPSSTDAIASSINPTLTVNIGDDDPTPASILEPILLSEDFNAIANGALPTGWARGSFLPTPGANVWLINGRTPLEGGKSAHISNTSAANGQVTYNQSSTSHTFFRTPLIDATGRQNLELTFLFRCNGEVFLGTYYDYGQILYSLDGTNYFVYVDEIQGFTATTSGAVTLPASLEGKTFYLAFGWVNDNSAGATPPFIIDQVQLTADVRVVEDDLNASKSEYLGPNQTVHFYDQVSGDLMATIENLGSYDYGCTQVVVDRAGASAEPFWYSGNAAANLTSKTLRVIPSHNTPGVDGNYRISLYYTAAEVTGWQSATGNTWGNAQLVKHAGPIADVTPANPYPGGAIEVITPVSAAAFVGNYRIQGQFSSGFSGFGVGIPGSNPPFPIEYLQFDAAAVAGDARLSWTFASDHAVRYFEVQRSHDGTTFETIGNVEPADRLASTAYYSDPRIVRHNQPVLYYRISGVDTDGGVFVSEVRQVWVQVAQFEVVAYPSPFGETLIAEVQAADERQVQITLTDMAGRTVYTGEWQAAAGVTRIPLEVRSLGAGLYTLTVSDGRTQRNIQVSRQ
ncbi:MAG: M43 family zinc metalloprotease [Bacteroidia bacterium]|nr:M43 family zinc metalloprotease [Bacteroidia bacterium]